MALIYPLLKMVLGTVCGILALEYYQYYRGYAPADLKVLYLGDLAVWLLAAAVLMGEGLRDYVALVEELHRRA
jgi:hypothetical protein